MPSPNTIVIVDASDHQRGSVALVVSGSSLAAGPIRARFMRWGYKKAYLHKDGWNVAESWLDLNATLTLTGELNVILLPRITYNLEEGSNYVLTLEAAGSIFVECPVRWSIAQRRGMAPEKPPVASSVPNKEPPNDEGAWRVACQIGSREAYHSFLSKYANSHFAADARTAIELIDRQFELTNAIRSEEEAWLEAKQSNSKEVITNFLLTYPDGRFSEEGRLALKLFMPDRLLVRTLWTSAGRAAPYGPDTCVFLLNAQGLVRNDRDFISGFATDQETGGVLCASACQSVKNIGVITDEALHSGTETITFDLPLVPSEVRALAISLSLDTRVDKSVGFEAIRATIELLDPIKNEVLNTLVLPEGGFGVKGRIVLVIRRAGNYWVMSENADSFEDGIFGICRRFGIVTD
jgi:stress response protein SCP2